MYKAADEAVVGRGSATGYTVTLTLCRTVTSHLEHYDQSVEGSYYREAFPDSGEAEGFLWKYIGNVGKNILNGLTIEKGSYIGTGTYGSANPVTLYTRIKPYIVILGYGGTTLGRSITRPFTDLHVLVPWSVFFNLNSNDTAQYRAHITEWGLDHISWYSSSSAHYAANLSGGTYRYLIIGTEGT